MIDKWLRHLIWRPLETAFRRSPLVPLHATVSQPVADVISIRVDNIITKAISRFGGGYDYSVTYLIDKSLVVDTGFPWSRRCLKATLSELGADKTIAAVLNTHHHEDHVGNNDLFSEMAITIYAHPLAIQEIRYPEEKPWYRNFMFGPVPSSTAQTAPSRITAGKYTFDVHHLPGHSADHICLFEPNERWLFSGDLYIAADLDSQLREVDGPQWIDSLEKAMALKPRCLFDAHGLVLTDEGAVHTHLMRKWEFLVQLRKMIMEAKEESQSLNEIVARVFHGKTFVNRLSFSDGWLSLLTGSDMSRVHLVKSFLAERA